MPSVLPAIGTAAYNGQSFDASSLVQVQSVPELDSSRRTVMYVRHLITVDGYITAATPNAEDGAMTAVRQNLLAQGGQLVLTGKGFGDLSANDPAGGGVRDVIYGPTPRLLDWIPLGGGISAKVKWQCEVHLPVCQNAAYQFQPMEANYELSWSEDKAGYTKRTYKATLRIPATRNAQGDRTIPDNAEAYYDDIYPDVPFGFRRIQRERVLDSSKTHLNVTIVDEMAEIALPPAGVVDVQAEHTVATGKTFHGVRSGTLSATYEMQRDANPIIAFRHFFALVKSRTLQLVGQQQGPSSFIPRSLTIREQLYSRKSSFTLTYNFVAPLSNLVAASGLWRPIPQSDWPSWVADMEQSGAYLPRGLANMMFQAQGGEIIDLCQANAGITTLNADSVSGQPPPMQAILTTAGAFINPNTSWLHYTCVSLLQQLDATVELKPLPTLDPGNPVLTTEDPNQFQQVTLQAGGVGGAQLQGGIGGGGGVQGGGAALINNAIGGAPIATITSVPVPIVSTIDSRTASTFYVTLQGSAVRAGYPIGVPILLGVGSAIATPANDERNYFVTGVTGQWSGIPIVGAAWSLRWILDRPPDADLPIFANPTASFGG